MRSSAAHTDALRTARADRMGRDGHANPSAIGAAVASVAGATIGVVFDRPAAFILAASALLLAHGLLLSRPFSAAFTRGISKIHDAVGSAVGALLFGPLYAGLAILSWPARRHRVTSEGGWTPAAGGAGATAGSSGANGADGKASAAPTWPGPDRVRAEGPRSLHAEDMLRVLLAVVLVQSAAAAVYFGVQNLRQRPADRQAPALLANAPTGTSEAAAFAGLDWVEDANSEMAEATAELVYTPFVGSSIRDYSGEYVNVSRQQRRTYAPKGLDSTKDSGSSAATGVDGAGLNGEDRILDVWFFGGSTMFGFDLQRDDHTIASEFVRLAEKAGVSVRARNYGSPGFVNYQETVRLALVLAEGDRPDVVVFYDGINDQAAQMMAVNESLSLPGTPTELGSFQLRSLLADSGLIPDGTDELPAPLGQDRADGPPTVDRLVEAVHDTYRTGMELSCALSGQYGFEVYHFWQPTLYSKSPLDPGEAELLPQVGLSGTRRAIMAEVSSRVAEGLPARVIDISDALDAADGPVLADLSHTNEEGAALVADAMFARVELDPLSATAGSCPARSPAERPAASDPSGAVPGVDTDGLGR